jgi:hypothetical protein
VESDTSNVVMALNNHQQSPYYVGFIIEDYISFNDCFCSLYFVHVKCEVNKATPYLAKYALYNPDYMWIKETLRHIYALLAF